MLKRTGLALAAAAVLAASVMAADVKSGIQPGNSVPAFDVVDVNGPNKGKQLCYRCSYGNAPVAAAFIKAGAPEAGQVISGLQKLVDQHGGKLRSFVVFMGGADLKPSIEKMASEKKVSIPLTFLPQGPSAADIQGYHINPAANATVMLWSRGTVRGNFVNPDKGQWTEIEKTAGGMLK